MSIIIIGGGIAGLSCGCYLQMNGYQTEILEMNPAPGGLCMAWDRGPYVFDGCFRWLVGTNPSSKFHRMWSELGAIEHREIFEPEEFLRIEGVNGEVLSLSSDLGQLERDLKRLSPPDAARVNALICAARRCAGVEPLDKPLEVTSGPAKLGLLLRHLPMLFTVGRWKNLSLGEYLAGYRSEFLRDALEAVAGDARMSALVLVMVLGLRTRKNAGYVAGGSRAFVRAIAGRYARLGGRLHPNTQVVSVTLEKNRVTGVKCADGTVVPASTVVSCADGRTTLFTLLGGRYLDRRFREVYARGEVFPGLFQVSLGLDRPLPEVPRAVSLPLKSPIVVDPKTTIRRLESATFGDDSGLCPAGKSILIVRFGGDHDYWAGLKQAQPRAYERAKEQLLQQIIQNLEQRFPGVSRNVGERDLATPATFSRFTGNWRGSIQGWLPTPQILRRPFRKTLSGLRGFYMAGHWVELGGGLPAAALSGRYAAQMICARDGNVFTTTAT